METTDYASALIERFYSTNNIVLGPLLGYPVTMHSIIPPGPYDAAQSPLSNEVKIDANPAYVTQSRGTVPNCTSGKIKLTPPA